LFPREYRPVDLACQGGISSKDHCSAWPGESFVGGERDDMRVPHRAGDHPGCHQASNMRDIRQEHRADGIGDSAEALPIWRPGIGRVPGNDDLWLVLPGQGFY